MRQLLAGARRIVVKVGTSTLTHPNGHLHLGRIEGLVRQLSDLHDEGKDILLVSSGAVGAGMGRLGLERRPLEMVAKQALAAIGQGLLMQRYEGLFAEYGRTVGQVLLTRQDLEDPARRSSSAATLAQLFQWRAIPIVNENDTVTSEEIRVGDNDTLSARVAALIGADLLVLLSDVEGFYPADPRTTAGLQPIAEVLLGQEMMQVVGAGAPGSANGTGGMVTKLHAARIAAEAGIPMLLANGARPGVLRQILSGEVVGTIFVKDGVR